VVDVSFPMTIDSRCINAFGIPNAVAKGRPFTLEFTLNPISEILFPFFRRAFSLHDGYRKIYGLPITEVDRFQVLPGDISATRFDDRVKYSITCTLEEFYQAFLGSYKPAEIADFLELHAVDVQEQVNMLANLVRHCEEKYQLVVPVHSQDGHEVNNLRFVPLGFSLDDVLDRLSCRHLSRRSISYGPYFTHHIREGVTVSDEVEKSPHFLVSHYPHIEHFFSGLPKPVLIAYGSERLPLALDHLLGTQRLSSRDWFLSRRMDSAVSEEELKERRKIYREINGYHELDFQIEYCFSGGYDDEMTVEQLHEGSGVLKAGRRLLSFDESYHGTIPCFISDVAITSFGRRLFATYHFIAGYSEYDDQRLFFPFDSRRYKQTFPEIVGVDQIDSLMKELGFEYVTSQSTFSKIKYNPLTRQMDSEIIS